MVCATCWRNVRNRSLTSCRHGTIVLPVCAFWQQTLPTLRLTLPLARPRLGEIERSSLSSQLLWNLPDQLTPTAHLRRGLLMKRSGYSVFGVVLILVALAGVASAQS